MEENGYSIEELIPIVAELTNKYTSFESTSIPYEKAQQLMGAVLYCIQEYEEYEKTKVRAAKGSEENSIRREENAELVSKKRVSAKEAYYAGCQKVIDKVKAAQEQYNDLILNFQDYGNKVYHFTIVNQIPEFFHHYDVRFEPQAVWMPDYPLAVPIQELAGIDYVYQYLQCICREQEFLAHLPEEYIKQTLKNYDEDYQNLFINLSEIILEDILKRRETTSEFI